MKKCWKYGLAIAMSGVMIIGSLSFSNVAFAGKKLKVSQKTVSVQVGKSKSISANMPVKFSISNKKIAVLKKVKKKQCSIYGKKKGSCKVVVKAGKQKITVKIEVKAKPQPKKTPEPKNTKTPAGTPTATPGVSVSPTPLPAGEDTVSSAAVGTVNRLGYQMLEQLREEENVVISPYSITSVLAMLNDGADGNTKSEIEKTLGIKDYDAWQKEFSTFYKENGSQETEKLKFHADNSYWINDTKFSFDGQLQKNYMEKIKNSYNAETISMDFANTNPQEQINDWVDYKTNGVIKEIIPGKIDENKIAAILLNTIYFDGKWDREFSEGWEMDFHGTKGNTKVQNMYKQREYYKYLNENGLEMLELPFRDTSITMDIVISEDLEKNATEIFSKLSEKETLFQKLGRQKKVLTNVTLPKFKLEYGIKDVSGQLRNLGIQDAFDIGKADFPGMQDIDKAPFYVDSVVHKAVVDVKENGVTAAAATAAMIEDGCGGYEEPEKAISFYVDRPFVFVLRDSKSGMIYFIGQIENLQ